MTTLPAIFAAGLAMDATFFALVALIIFLGIVFWAGAHRTAGKALDDRAAQISKDIADALAAQGFEVDRRKIQLADAIKVVGEYSVPVRLHREVTAQVKVHVAAEGAPEAPAAQA